jgi:hypothetical protein
LDGTHRNPSPARLPSHCRYKPPQAPPTRHHAREDHSTAARPHLVTSGRLDRSFDASKPNSNRPSSCVVFQCSPLLEIYLGEFIVLCHPCRSRPYRGVSAIATARRSPVRTRMALPRAPAHHRRLPVSIVNYSSVDQWIGLHQNIPLRSH